MLSPKLQPVAVLTTVRVMKLAPVEITAFERATRKLPVFHEIAPGKWAKVA